MRPPEPLPALDPIHRRLADFSDSTQQAQFLEAWRRCESQLNSSNFSTARLSLNELLTANFRVSDTSFSLITSSILSFLTSLVQPEIVLPLINLLFFLFSQSSVSLLANAPFPILRECYFRFDGDFQIKREIHNVVRLLIGNLCEECPGEICDFLFGAFQEFGVSHNHAAELRILFRSVGNLVRKLENLDEVLPVVFELVERYFEPDTVYFVYPEVAQVAGEIASRKVNIIEQRLSLFQRLVASLDDIRLQPNEPVIAMLVSLEYHHSATTRPHLPIETLFAILHMGERDGQDCESILHLLGNLVIDDRSIIDRLCPQELDTLTILIQQNEYRITEKVMWLCWNIVVLGYSSGVEGIIEHREIAEAMLDYIEACDEKFILARIVPRVSDFVRRGRDLESTWFFKGVIHRIGQMADRSPALAHAHHELKRRGRWL
jgi:hypothetical protein